MQVLSHSAESVMADELNEEQVTVWEERVAGVMAKSSSVKLLKQACS